ncbi:2-hydroxyacid dehydrogenase [Methylobacterium sp. sgz302541]|uniref:2-hydroxyacid dehydrogenase n=1 Tax=unclassified Methylobacterium TaxID=2615210 RepID=UPI003D3597A2
MNDTATGPRGPITILSIGDMAASVERDLAGHFTVLSTNDAAMAELVAAHGPAIRAIATRGREPADAALIDRLPGLELIASFAVGYDSVDLDACRRRGVVVTNTPDVLTDEVADFTVGLMLATIRRIPQADRFVRSGAWGAGAFPLGPSLRDRSIGIAGMGRIGRAIAARLVPFGRPIHYHARHPVADLPFAYHERLSDLAAAVDVLIVILPGGPSTRNLVDAAVLEALGPNGILINVARGSVVDETALVDALKSGRILGAGLDVFAEEPHVPPALTEIDTVVLTPHAGSATHETRALMAALGLRNLTSWFSGHGPVTPVTETPWPLP